MEGVEWHEDAKGISNRVQLQSLLDEAAVARSLTSLTIAVDGCHRKPLQAKSACLVSGVRF